MRNPKLVPYETIVRATSGEPEAIDEVLRHYSKRIRLASLENGQVNKDTEDNIKRRLIAALFQFRFDGVKVLSARAHTAWSARRCARPMQRAGAVPAASASLHPVCWGC